MELLIIVGLRLAFSVFWGFVTYRLIVKKGYYENWFWWGFFFGIIAFIVALTKRNVGVLYTDPQYAQAQTGRYHEAMLQSGGWSCVRCGRVNPSYTGTCGCGASKPGPQAGP